MKILKIHFTKNRKGKMFSKAIMWYDNSEYSHCTVEFYLKSIDEEVIYHSSLSGGVNFFSKPLFLKENEIVKTYEIEVSKEVYDVIMKQLIKNCGKKYAWLQNLGIVYVDLMRRVGKKISNPWKSGYNCSELIYKHVLLNLFEIEEEYDQQIIKPTDVDNILMEKGI